MVLLSSTLGMKTRIPSGLRAYNKIRKTSLATSPNRCLITRASQKVMVLLSSTLGMKTRIPSGLWAYNKIRKTSLATSPNRCLITRASQKVMVLLSSMTLPEYSNMIKNLDWKSCNIKAGSSPADELVSKDVDIDGLKSFEILGLYFLISLWYDSIDRTWISLDKLTFQELICDEDCSFYVFSALNKLNTEESVTLEIYILGEIKIDLSGKSQISLILKITILKKQVMKGAYDYEELVSEFEECVKIDVRLVIYIYIR
ncbi:hypothetical protein RclHR1_02970010 [Rhizophagus clarus]|uniref:Uncharacterized protein n=1 Tax=Rhizophagus clarus TaxID=94130 RepID=A0A2Z6R5G6_9GLOM|nr:hypothetical protein RclHR1_02970010 [Rhizophagus clarus]